MKAWSATCLVSVLLLGSSAALGSPHLSSPALSPDGWTRNPTAGILWSQDDFGSGLATVDLAADAGTPGRWRVVGVHYEFVNRAPAPWLSADVGSVGLPGSASHPGDAFVVNGAGAAAIACVELMKRMGVPHDNVIMCDRSGVIYQGRTEQMDQWKSAHAARTEARTLGEALVGADIFLGLSAKDALQPEMVEKMGDRPIIFAMANPDPEILPPLAKAVKPDAIVATGRSIEKSTSSRSAPCGPSSATSMARVSPSRPGSGCTCDSMASPAAAAPSRNCARARA